MTDIKTITCLKELEERRELEYDVVIFTVKEEISKYNVRYYFLNLKKGTNNVIFKLLKISENEITEIAEKTYGYERQGGGDWPESKMGDFPALTRLVKELYLIIEERKPVYTKFTRFEIMEI